MNTDLDYLNLELKRINLLIRRLVSEWESAEKDWIQQFSGLTVSKDDVLQALKETEGPKAITDQASSSMLPWQEAYATLIDTSHAWIKHNPTPRLLQLKKVFSLSSFEYDAFLICLCVACDLRYEQVYGYLQNDVTRKLPNVELILRLLQTTVLDGTTNWQYLQPEANLFKFGLLHASYPEPDNLNLLRNGCSVAPEIVTWLLGAYQPPTDLAAAVHIFDPDPSFLEIFTSTQLHPLPFDQINNEKPLMVFCGPDHLINLASAQSAVGAFNTKLFEIDLGTLVAMDKLDRVTFCWLLRDAWLNDAIPLITSKDCKAETKVLNDLVVEILAFPGIALVVSDQDWISYAASDNSDKPVYKWLITPPDSAHKFKIWDSFLPEDSAINPDDLKLLSDQFVLSSGQIVNAIRSARNHAMQARSDMTITQLYEAARQFSNNQLEQLAQKIQPRYGWQDIVLPEEEMSALHEITTMVRDRTLVLERWGLGEKLVSSKGIAALFAGEPGTGKTLAAQVIARELGMDLYKIDLSTIVSKYIGETEKNLETIFSQARNSNAILFFDEADAIFGKRSEVKDAHDRYANIEVGYLLQRMETYDGIVILATNLHANMDEAFTRRLQFIIDFPFPDAAQRRQIWSVLFPPGVPREPELDLGYFAERFKLAGGNIRNIIVTAVFQAASEGAMVAERHLLHGARREMKKLGRLIDEKEFVRL